MASQWRMMWWKFSRHRLAVALRRRAAVLYASILISEFLAPYSLHSRQHRFHLRAAAGVHFFHEGRFVGPFVYGFHYNLNMDTLKREYTLDTTDVSRSASSAGETSTTSGA